MLRVTCVLLVSCLINWARILEELDHTEIISSSEYLAIGGTLAGVDVRTVGARREDSLDGPAEWATPSSPLLVLVIGGSASDLLSGGAVMEQDLITRAVGHESTGVHGEIDVSDRAVMALDSLNRFVVLVHIVSDDLAVMGTNGAD